MESILIKQNVDILLPQHAVVDHLIWMRKRVNFYQWTVYMRLIQLIYIEWIVYVCIYKIRKSYTVCVPLTLAQFDSQVRHLLVMLLLHFGWFIRCKMSSHNEMPLTHIYIYTKPMCSASLFFLLFSHVIKKLLVLLWFFFALSFYWFSFRFILDRESHLYE